MPMGEQTRKMMLTLSKHIFMKLTNLRTQLLCSWSIDLTWDLVNAIVENPAIKQGLFPSPGGNQSVSKGGSRSKIEYQCDLVKAVFEDHATYGPAFQCAMESSNTKIWGLKIKNRLQW